MVARADILAGRAVILVDIQDNVDKQLRQMRSKLKSFTNFASELGGDLFRGGLAGTGASFFPVKDFISFQDSILFLQTKLQATDKQIVGLEAHIRTLGRSTSFTSQEVAKAATDFAQAGFSIDEITKSLQAALDLARGSQVELSTSTSILANAIRTFQVDAGEAANFSSKFIAAARQGTLDLVDLGESLKYSSGTFKLLNVSIDETLALITQLSKSGLKASLAGTSLNTAFLNLAGEADKLKSALGVVFDDADFEQPLIVLTKIEKALQGMSKTKKISVIQDLVNIRGARAVFGELIQGLGDLDKVTKEIQNSNNEARLSAEKLDSKLGGVFRRAKSAFEEMLISFGSTTEGVLTRFGTNVQHLLTDLSSLATKFPEITQSVLLIGPASLVAGAGILSLVWGLGKLASFITPLISINSLLFDMGARFIGLHIRNITSAGDFLARPYIIARKAAEDYAIAAPKALAKTNKARTTLFSFSRKGSASLAERVAKRQSALDIVVAAKGGFPLTKELATRQALINTFESKQAAKLAQGISKRQSALKAAVAAEDALKPKGFFTRERSLFGSAKSLKTGKDASLAAGSGSSFLKFVAYAKRGLTSLSGASFVFRKIWEGILATNWLAKFISGFKMLVSLVKVFGTLLKFTFTTFTTLSGWGNIFTVLLLVGDKLPGINQMLSALGKGFSNLFNGIGQALKDTLPALQLMGMGLSDMFSGDILGGVELFRSGLGHITGIISEGMTKAWAGFMEEVGSGAEWIKVTLTGAFNSVLAVFEVLGSNLASIFKGGAILIKGDGTLLETIKSAFSTENMRSFFIGLIQAIGEIGKGLNTIIATIFSVLNAIKTTFFEILRAIANSYLFGSDEAKAAVKAMDGNAGRRGELERSIAAEDATQYIIRSTIKGIANREERNEKLANSKARQAKMRAELSALGPGGPEYDLASSNEALQKTIQELMGNVAKDNGPAPSPQEIVAQQSAKQKALEDVNAQLTKDWVLGLGEAKLSKPFKEGMVRMFEDSGLSKGLINVASTDEANIELQRSKVDEAQKVVDAALLQQKIAAIGTSLANPKGREAALAEEVKAREVLAQAQIGLTEAQKGLDNAKQLNQSGGLGEVPGIRPRTDAENTLIKDFVSSDFWDKSLGDMASTTLDGIGNFLEPAAAPFKNLFNNVAEGLNPQAQQMKDMAPAIGKAVVGSFEETRGRLASAIPRTEQLQKDTNKYLEDIDGKLGDLNKNKTPFVFAGAN